MALSLLESNHQGGLDMFPPSDPQSPDAFHSQATRQRPHNGVGQWDPWSSPSPAGLGPPTKQPPPSSCTIQRIRRSNSLTPPSNSMVYPQDPWGSNQVRFVLSIHTPKKKGKTKLNSNSRTITAASSRDPCLYRPRAKRPTAYLTVPCRLRIRWPLPAAEADPTRFTATITTDRHLSTSPEVA
jgi:hypothetical protein